MFLLENFPNEVLELIFIHVNLRGNILECTEISPRINNVISNSIRIMKNVPITWNSKKDDLEDPLLKTRKYSIVTILDENQCSLRLMNFFASYSNTLNHVSLDNCSFEMSELYFTLSMVAATLERIIWKNTKLTGQKEFPKIEMPKLKYLQLYGTKERSDSVVFISIVNTCSLTRLFFDIHHVCNYSSPFPAAEALVLIEFISQQRNLVELWLPKTIAEVATKYWFETKPLEAKVESLYFACPT